MTVPQSSHPLLQQAAHDVQANPVDWILCASSSGSVIIVKKNVQAPASRVMALKFSNTFLPSTVWLTSGCHWIP